MRPAQTVRQLSPMETSPNSNEVMLPDQPGRVNQFTESGWLQSFTLIEGFVAISFILIGLLMGYDQNNKIQGMLFFSLVGTGFAGVHVC